MARNGLRLPGLMGILTSSNMGIPPFMKNMFVISRNMWPKQHQATPDEAGITTAAGKAVDRRPKDVPAT